MLEDWDICDFGFTLNEALIKPTLYFLARYNYQAILDTRIERIFTSYQDAYSIKEIDARVINNESTILYHFRLLIVLTDSLND